MRVKTVSIKKFLKNKNDIYKNINIVAKRARQINDLRYSKIEAMQNIDDSDQLEDFNEIDFNQQKSISKAMGELIEEELEYKDFNNSDDSNTKDEK